MMSWRKQPEERSYGHASTVQGRAFWEGHHCTGYQCRFLLVLKNGGRTERTEEE